MEKKEELVGKECWIGGYPKFTLYLAGKEFWIGKELLLSNYSLQKLVYFNEHYEGHLVIEGIEEREKFIMVKASRKQDLVDELNQRKPYATLREFYGIIEAFPRWTAGEKIVVENFRKFIINKELYPDEVQVVSAKRVDGVVHVTCKFNSDKTWMTEEIINSIKGNIIRVKKDAFNPVECPRLKEINESYDKHLFFKMCPVKDGFYRVNDVTKTRIDFTDISSEEMFSYNYEYHQKTGNIWFYPNVYKTFEEIKADFEIYKKKLVIVKYLNDNGIDDYSSEPEKIYSLSTHDKAVVPIQEKLTEMFHKYVNTYSNLKVDISTGIISSTWNQKVEEYISESPDEKRSAGTIVVNKSFSKELDRVDSSKVWEEEVRRHNSFLDYVETIEKVILKFRADLSRDCFKYIPRSNFPVTPSHWVIAK